MLSSDSSVEHSVHREFGDVDIEMFPKEHQEKKDFIETLTFTQRLKHFTYAWYACSMSTGGVAFTLSVLPIESVAIITLGKAMFVINIIVFLTITALLITRFIIHPGTFKRSFTNPHEGFFFATGWLTLATMMTNTTAYGIPNTGPWLIGALRVAFWMYTVCATILAIVYYHVLFTVKKLVITNVLPGWVLPIFPAMLVGTLASAIAKTQPVESAAQMLVAGLTFQGLGMFLALMMYGIYFGRLLTSGLPVDASRPAMFIAVGPPSFTALALIGMAQDATVTKVFTEYYNLPGITNPAAIPDILQLGALLSAIFLWALAFWFFAIATFAAIEAFPRNDFHLNWYAYVFPNVGFTVATIKIGERLNSSSILGVGAAMGVVLFVLWLLIVFSHIKAVTHKMIMWPGKDEDAH
ncbi:hypothetical protein EYC80_000928 [Monilinia laxa]|uniref:C4-dicarboxylate transporter/malic acid transport protein n=1 Tax=Monilinia laxa TaxID=61186 RepID=A0A5N6K7Q8_MONLA|nr:hypothetical protein EYC80_000928 [Monilinia laxa]